MLKKMGVVAAAAVTTLMLAGPLAFAAPASSEQTGQEGSSADASATSASTTPDPAASTTPGASDQMCEGFELINSVTGTAGQVTGPLGVAGVLPQLGQLVDVGGACPQ